MDLISCRNLYPLHNQRGCQMPSHILIKLSSHRYVYRLGNPVGITNAKNQSPVRSRNMLQSFQ